MKDPHSNLYLFIVAGSIGVATSACLTMPGSALQGIQGQAKPSTNSVPAAAGEIAVSAGEVGAEIETQISSLPDKSLYTVFAVAEGSQGLAADSGVKKFEKVIPRRLFLQNYASAIIGAGNGKTIRYSIYFPDGYYDDPDAEYPLLIFLGGAGEIPSDAANPETIFTAGQYRINKTPYPANIALGASGIT